MSKPYSRSPQEILRDPYARVLVPAEDGTYTAEVLEFPGCYAEGDTPTEAIRNLEDAAVSWIEAALEQGQQIPPPVANYGYSGKINLRLPKSIHKQAAFFAQRDDISLNQFFISAIAARVGAEEFYDRLARNLEHRLMFTVPSVNIQHIQHTATNILFLGAIQTETVFQSDRPTLQRSPLLNFANTSVAVLPQPNEVSTDG